MFETIMYVESRAVFSDILFGRLANTIRFENSEKKNVLQRSQRLGVVSAENCQRRDARGHNSKSERVHCDVEQAKDFPRLCAVERADERTDGRARYDSRRDGL